MTIVVLRIPRAGTVAVPNQAPPDPAKPLSRPKNGAVRISRRLLALTAQVLAARRMDDSIHTGAWQRKQQAAAKRQEPVRSSWAAVRTARLYPYRAGLAASDSKQAPTVCNSCRKCCCAPAATDEPRAVAKFEGTKYFQ